MTQATKVSSRGERGKEKLRRIPVQFEQPATQLKKPDWIRVKLPNNEHIQQVKSLLRNKKLTTVCEEASCPNLPTCFNKLTATFMIMGDICTRRCSFCDVAHGRPASLDPEEPKALADAVKSMGLRFVVVTSVDRDDLRDGGAQHFIECIQAIRKSSPTTRIETLVPDFRGRLDKAIDILKQHPPDVFNHNIETVGALYKTVRPGSDYQHSLNLLQRFRALHPDVPTKSGIMLGLGETDDQIDQVLQDLRAHDVTRVTLGQYLQPSPHHHPVHAYVTPEKFEQWRERCVELGFTHVASGPLVRSSFHAELQDEGRDIVS